MGTGAKSLVAISAAVVAILWAAALRHDSVASPLETAPVCETAWCAVTIF